MCGQSGMGTCKLPFKYSPSYTCDVSQDDEGTCQGKGGYMMSGWCVKCKDLTYTECSRADQDSAWCAVEGECGTASTDYGATADGGYGWTHWDNCIGSPAGFMPGKGVELKADKRAKLSRAHGVSVESVVMKHDHKEVVGPAKGDVSESKGDVTLNTESKTERGPLIDEMAGSERASEAKAAALHKAIAAAIHLVLYFM